MRDIELINIEEFAAMMRRSKSWIRLRLTERRQGKSDILESPESPAFPAPITTRPKQRLLWMRDECTRYIERLNDTANRQVLQPQGTQLSPETLRSAAQLGLLDDRNIPSASSRKRAKK